LAERKPPGTGEQGAAIVIFEIQLAGKKHRVETTNRGEREVWSVDGSALEGDVIEVSPGVYSVLLDGQSYEVRVEPAAGKLRVTAGGKELEASVLDPRAWQRSGHGSGESEGRQQIVAPMPGKIVSVLVSPGDAVQAGQGLMVVEAMKMQNEIRSPKSGAVERLAVIEGQTVNAGEVVAVVV
jgi:biotin carboxyl carrier protein